MKNFGFDKEASYWCPICQELIPKAGQHNSQAHAVEEVYKFADTQQGAEGTRYCSVCKRWINSAAGEPHDIALHQQADVMKAQTNPTPSGVDKAAAAHQKSVRERLHDHLVNRHDSPKGMDSLSNLRSEHEDDHVYFEDQGTPYKHRHHPDIAPRTAHHDPEGVGHRHESYGPEAWDSWNVPTEREPGTNGPLDAGARDGFVPKCGNCGTNYLAHGAYGCGKWLKTPEEEAWEQKTATNWTRDGLAIENGFEVLTSQEAASIPFLDRNKVIISERQACSDCEEPTWLTRLSSCTDCSTMKCRNCMVSIGDFFGQCKKCASYDSSIEYSDETEFIPENYYLNYNIHTAFEQPWYLPSDEDYLDEEGDSDEEFE